MGDLLKAVLKISVAIFSIGVAAKVGKDGVNDGKSLYNNNVNEE